MPIAPPPVVIHVPHAAVEIPDDVRTELLLGDAALELEVLRMTDWFTDELFDSPHTTMIRYPVSRLVVDPERFLEDEKEPMSERGMGAVYTSTSHRTTLRDATSPGRRAELIARFYVPHHRALERAVQAALDAHGRCLVIDGHSFPSVPLPYEPDKRPERPDVCIGTDAFHTPAWLRDATSQEVLRQGLDVRIDSPFAGALVPMRYYRTDARVRALMIELNRSLYVNEATAQRSEGFDGLRRAVAEIVGAATRAHAEAT